MKSTRNLLLATVAALTLLAPLARAATPQLVIQPGGKLWLEGTSTIHEYKADASKLAITMHDDTTKWPADKTGNDAIEGLILANGVNGLDVVVGVTGLHSGKDGLDKNMYKSLKAEKNPEITFHLAGYTAASVENGSKIEAKGKLAIAGVEREVPITVTALKDGQNVRFKGTVGLLMTQYGITPPKMMMGALKVADAVTVSFDFAVGAKAEGAVSSAQ